MHAEQYRKRMFGLSDCCFCRYSVNQKHFYPFSIKEMDTWVFYTFVLSSSSMLYVISKQKLFMFKLNIIFHYLFLLSFCLVLFLFFALLCALQLCFGLFCFYRLAVVCIVFFFLLCFILPSFALINLALVCFVQFHFTLSCLVLFCFVLLCFASFYFVSLLFCFALPCIVLLCYGLDCFVWQALVCSLIMAKVKIFQILQKINKYHYLNHKNVLSFKLYINETGKESDQFVNISVYSVNDQKLQ